MTLSFDQFNSSMFEMSMANVIVEKKAYTKEDVKNVLVMAEKEHYHCLCVKIETTEKNDKSVFTGRI